VGCYNFFNEKMLFMGFLSFVFGVSLSGLYEESLLSDLGFKNRNDERTYWIRGDFQASRNGFNGSAALRKKRL